MSANNLLNDIDEVFDQTILWQMSYAERMAMFYLFDKMKKLDTAIEIGSCQGGFLKELSKRFKKVYSCDITHVEIKNKDSYNNVVWIEGNSQQTVPDLIQTLNNNDEDLNFVLIDGNHAYHAVKIDIENIIKYNPKSETIIMIHDSWYHQSRDAISMARWNDNKYIHYVEKDFVGGDLFNSPSEGLIGVGGLAMAYMNTQIREGVIEIKQTQDFMYRTLLL